MKFRKKPVVIEAFKYDGDLKDRNGLFYVPFWAQEAYKKGLCITVQKLVIYLHVSCISRRWREHIMFLLETMLSRA